jgi:ABC-type branched-subunit amino acid transport system permease subunit
MSAAPKKTRLYRELLTPLLHRRFTSAASLVLCACYVETILIRNWASSECGRLLVAVVN